MEDSAVDGAALDGNAIGGLLTEVFGAEMTTATATCASCGAVSQVAELIVYRPGLGTVVRCRSCESVLMVFVEVRGITCVDLTGLVSLVLRGHLRGQTTSMLHCCCQSSSDAPSMLFAARRRWGVRGKCGW